MRNLSHENEFHLQRFIFIHLHTPFQYTASSVSGQDERCDWLPERAIWSYLARTGLPAESRKKNFHKRPIDHACSVKMAGYWPRSFFTCLWTPTPSRSINTQKKNLANIQLCWPHTWSITHTYQMIQSRLLLQSSLCVAESYLSLISAVLSLIRQNTFVEKSVFLL